MVHTITRVETEAVGADYELLPENTTLSNYDDPNEAYAKSATVTSIQRSWSQLTTVCTRIWGVMRLALNSRVLHRED